MLIFFYFIQVCVFTTNHHLKGFFVYLSVQSEVVLRRPGRKMDGLNVIKTSFTAVTVPYLVMKATS